MLILFKKYESTDGNCKSCLSQTDTDVTLILNTDWYYLIFTSHYPSVCSQALVITCHPGWKLIRILSEGNLKEEMTHSQIFPSFDVKRFILTFALRTWLQRQTGGTDVLFVPAAHNLQLTHHTQMS